MEGNRTVTDILDELHWRGLIAQHTDIDALRAALTDGQLTFYCGFDPTAPSLHHGHLVAVKVMRHLQMAGHHPLALVGGATGLVGDPRDKGERTLNTPEVVAGWARSLQAQLENLLDFEGDNPARIVNNLDWTGELTAIGLLRDLGKYFRMGTMLSKDIVARRLASEEGISYTEFSYQILQANDYLELFRRYGCTLEIGGNDQWGNLVGGMDLIHKVEGASVHVMTNPLITKADGTKFGKTEGGAVWLNPEMLSPYAFYQFWLQTDDADVVRFLKIFTFLGREEIERLEAARIGFREALDAKDMIRIAQADELFHDAIYAGTYNDKLVQMLNNLRDQMYRYRLEYIKDTGKRQILLHEHEQILTAVKTRNIALARQTMREHIDNQELTISRRLSEELLEKKSAKRKEAKKR